MIDTALFQIVDVEGRNAIAVSQQRGRAAAEAERAMVKTLMEVVRNRIGAGNRTPVIKGNDGLATLR